MCLPIGARVYQLDTKDSRVAAAAKVLPLLLAFAGLISCGSAIVNENISIYNPFFGSFQAIVTIGFRQLRLQLVGEPGVPTLETT